MKKSNVVTTVLVILVVILLTVAYSFSQPNNDGGKESKKDSKNLPTLYLSGISDSSNSLNNLITVAKRNGSSGHLNVNIDKNGHAKYSGKLTSNDNQPIIQINMAHKQTSINQQTAEVTNVLRYLRKKYHYRYYNTVGMTSGAVVFFRVAALNSNQKDFPQAERMVSIAGPFNGILHVNDKANANKIYTSGKPLIERPANQMYPGYAQLLKDAKKMRNGVQFLNIYGNLKNKTNSDGLVTTNSAESLKYLVAQKNDSLYQRLEVMGRDGQHRGLPNVQIVQRSTNRFLFDTY